MPFIKRAGFLIFVLGALAAGTWAYFQLKKNKRPSLDAASLFPARAFAYLETSDIFELDRRISSRSMAVDGLRVLEPVDGLCVALHTIDSIVELNENVREQVEQATFHLAFYGSKKISWLLGFNLSSVAFNDAAKEELSAALSARQVDGLLHFSLPRAGQPAYLSVEGGVVLVSDDRSLIASAMGEDDDRLWNDPDFMGFRKLHPPGQLLSIYIDHDSYGSSAYADVLDLSLLGHSGISGNDVECGTSEVRINGFVKPDSLDPIHFIGGQTPFSTADLITSLPGGCTDFVAFAIDSLSHPRLEITREKILREFWTETNDTAMYNVRGAFYKNSGGCLARFSMPLSDAPLMLLTVRDSALAREHLTHMSDSITRDEMVCFKLRQDVPLMQPLAKSRCRFATLFNHSIFFAENRNDLLRLNTVQLSGNSMGDDQQFTRYSSEHISEKFNFLAWCSPRSTPALISRLLGLDSLKAAKAFRNFRQFSYSLLNTGVVRSRFHLLYSVEKEQKESNTLWTTVLDTTVVRQPALFRNHNTGENEIVLQDSRHQLYLVSAKGKVLWKKKLEGGIISNIYVVDAFKNQKFQMLFNTKEAIHLIDRNGKDVEGFPRRLKAGTNCGLSLFDYEGSRDYRIMLPCSDRQIYNFGIDGKELSTFVRPRTDAEVRLPVQYLNIGGNEYLVTIDKEGRIYTFNRRGQARGSLRNKATAGCPAFYADAGANAAASFIFYADEKNGLLNKISFTDKKEIIKLGQDIEQGISRFDLVDNNRFSDLILCYEKEVTAYDLAGNVIYKRDLDCEPTHIEFFNSPSFSGNVVFCDSSKIVLVQNRAKNTVLRFPADVPAKLADLFRTNEQYLIVPHGQRLTCVSLH